MKIKIFSIALFFAFFISNAQTNLPQYQSNTLECEYISNSVYPCETEFSHNTSQTYLDTFDPVVYNVFIWDIRNDQGGGQGNPLNEYEALTAVAELNKTFNEYKIFFKYNGFDIINNTTLYNIFGRNDLYDAVTDDPQHPEWVKSNSFNIYIKYNMEGGGRDLTDGQRIRMQERIIEDYPHYSATMNTVSSLYEPYKGEYFLAGPLPVDEEGRLNPPKFQYGFDYVFYDTSQANVYNQPTPWSFTNFWFGNVTQSIDVYHNTPITHPNHTAFKILQIDINNPRMCYNNYNRAPSGGTIIKFNDNVLNTNVTISPQDSMSINNEALIDDLDPGLYNIIKNYENGNTQETVILKENN